MGARGVSGREHPLQAEELLGDPPVADVVGHPHRTAADAAHSKRPDHRHIGIRQPRPDLGREGRIAELRVLMHHHQGLQPIDVARLVEHLVVRVRQRHPPSRQHDRIRLGHPPNAPMRDVLVDRLIRDRRREGEHRRNVPRRSRFAGSRGAAC